MSTDADETRDVTEQWVADQVAKFEPAELRRAATLLSSLAGGGQ